MSVLFLAKHRPFAQEAAEMLRLNVEDSTIVFGNPGEPFPSSVYERQYGYVISYISPWIVPARALELARTAAVNLHPGPPEYPGIGCTNFAIYDGATEFGITVHHMDRTVDTGRIIHVERFPVFECDTVHSLTQRCYANIYTAFTRMLPDIIGGRPLRPSGEQWKRKPYTRKELNDLCVITPDMPQEEVRRRVRATSFPGREGAHVDLAGIRFDASPGEKQ